MYFESHLRAQMCTYSHQLSLDLGYAYGTSTKADAQGINYTVAIVEGCNSGFALGSDDLLGLYLRTFHNIL